MKLFKHWFYANLEDMNQKKTCISLEQGKTYNVVGSFFKDKTVNRALAVRVVGLESDLQYMGLKISGDFLNKQSFFARKCVNC